MGGLEDRKIINRRDRLVGNNISFSLVARADLIFDRYDTHSYYVLHSFLGMIFLVSLSPPSLRVLFAMMTATNLMSMLMSTLMLNQQKL